MNKGHVSKKHTSFSPIQWQSQNPKPAKKNTYCPQRFQVAGIEMVKNDATIRASS